MAAEEGKNRRRANDLGPTGQVVALNVARLRTSLGLSTYRLAELLADLGRPIAASAISKIEGGTRRVDADDLMALAIALDVPPAALLLPPTAQGRILLADDYQNDAGRVWDWAQGARPLHLPPDDDGEYWNAFEARAKPPGRRQFLATTPKAPKSDPEAVAVLTKLARNRHRGDPSGAAETIRPFEDPAAE